MQQSKVASFEARWPSSDDGSIVNMADEVDLKKNEGEFSFTVTLLFRKMLIKLGYVLCQNGTGQLINVCSVIAKYLLKFLLLIFEHVSFQKWP